MTDYELMDKLGRALAYGETDQLAAYLAPECDYASEYADLRLDTPEKILEHLKNVYSYSVDECRYTYEVVPLDDVTRGISHLDLNTIEGMRADEYGMLLYRYSDRYPIAVAAAMVDDNGRLSSILLSRNKSWFNVDFYMEELDEDSPDDLPDTVEPLTPQECQYMVFRRASSGQHPDDEKEEITGDEYIWLKADEFSKSWLSERGYKILETRIFDDCIGYRCSRNSDLYTIYMFAYGKEEKVRLDGEYCKKLLEPELSKNSCVLVMCLNVRRFRTGDKIEYRVWDYAGHEDSEPELWRVTEAGGKPILEYFPRKEIIDAAFRLMYAFNRDDLDAYDCAVCEHNPAFEGPDSSGTYYNRAFYGRLLSLHKKYGEMKYGYVSFGGAVYCGAPYLDGYGFLSISVSNKTDRIIAITAYPFDGGEREAEEFIKANMRESDALFGDYPGLVKAEALPPVETERFALKLTFDNGEIKKYVLPISPDDEKDEAVSHSNHVFTDKIWQSAFVTDHRDAEIRGYAKRRAAVQFKNGFFISGLLCYQESEAYSEPIIENEVIYEDGLQRVGRLWTWQANFIWEDKDTGIQEILLSGDAFNYDGVSTFASRDGKRLCSINFDYIDNFHEGLAKVGKYGCGLGYIDRDMNFVIPMIYDQAEEFVGGKAKVMREGRWLFIDKTGRETELKTADNNSKYQLVGNYHEGRCKVSTLELKRDDRGYLSDYSDTPGTWGFVNEAGEKVIAPQYIYAGDFSNGIAFVCKGKWTIDKKWDNEYNTGLYWTDEELWGAIDKAGNVVIPFIFDEINRFCGAEEFYSAHYGGWTDGHWGVIDNRGNWLVEPIFEDIGYEYDDGLFVFYNDNKWAKDVLLGVYDIRQKTVIFEPQFFDVRFRGDGWIKVEVFDEELGRRIEKLIDRNGNEKFHSIYSSIYTWKKPYEVVIRDENGDRHGLIDENGKAILPCKYKAAWNGISYERKRLVFEEGEKQGIMDFDGNVIVPPIYYEIVDIEKPLPVVRVGEKYNCKEGMILPDGTPVIPAEFKSIKWYKDDYIVCCRKGHCEMLRYVRKRQ